MLKKQLKMISAALMALVLFALISGIFANNAHAQQVGPPAPVVGASQIRVGVINCTRVGGPIRFSNLCLPGGLEGVVKIEGWNQRNQWSVRTDGPGSIVTPWSVNDWWFDFKREVKVSYTKYGIKNGKYQPISPTYVVKINNKNLSGCKWANVALIFNTLYAGHIPTSINYSTACTSK